MAEVLEHIDDKGRGYIWSVEKALELDSDDIIMQKAKKKKYDVEIGGTGFRQDLKQHGTQYSVSQYWFWGKHWSWACRIPNMTVCSKAPQRFHHSSPINSRKLLQISC